MKLFNAYLFVEVVFLLSVLSIPALTRLDQWVERLNARNRHVH